MLLPHTALAELVVRSFIVYFFLLALLRVLGRRELGRFSLSDVLVMVLLATAVRYSLLPQSSSAMDGLILAVLLVLWDWLIREWTLRSRFVQRILRPRPIPLISDGQLLSRNVRRELLSKQEVEAQLRLLGIDSIDEVKAAFLEPSGRISAIRWEDEQRPR